MDTSPAAGLSQFEGLVEACEEWGEEGAPARFVGLKCDAGGVISHAEGCDFCTKVQEEGSVSLHADA